MKSDNTLILLLVGLLVYSQWAGPAKPGPAMPSRPAPTAEWQQAVAPVKAIVAGKPHAEVVATFFTAAADVVRRDSTRITSTAQVAAWLQDASSLQLQGTNLVQAFPGLGAALDAVVKTAIGDKPVALTPEARARLVAAFDAVAWAAT